MSLPITVVIPVGPQKAYKQWLDECLQSVFENNPDEVIVIDDMANLDERWKANHSGVMYYRNDWLLGCADSWNRGIALAQNKLVFMMGSDDKMLPGCLQACVNAYESHNRLDAWYNVTIQLQDGTLQDLPNNLAAVTQNLWQMTGGFGPSAFAAPDAWLLSVLLVHMPDRIVQVEQGTPYCWSRQHEFQDTPRQFGRFFVAATSIRDVNTKTWTPPEWEGWL